MNTSIDKDLQEIERIEKMTPDEAYAYSVNTLGRDPMITDRMDAAARIPEAEMNRMRASVESAGASAPSNDQHSPVEGDTIVKDGIGETMFGKYKRIVDQQTGATKFINTETGKEEVPPSVQMQGVMNRGINNEMLLRNGKTWDDAIKLQDDAKFQRMMGSTRRALEEQKRGAAERRARAMQRWIDTGGAFGAALSTLAGEIARGEDGSIFDKSGKPIDKRIRISKDGNHIYLMGKAEPGALRAVNDSRRKNGSASDYTAVMAYRELDRNGNALKNADGTERPPMIAVTDQPGGDPKAQRRFRIMSSGDVARKLLDAWTSQGRGEDDAKSAILTEVFGGIDPLGWGKTLKPKQTGSASAEAATIRAASAREVQRMKGEQALEQIAANNKGKLDLTKLTGEQKQKLLDSANELKKYGIDVGLQIAQEGNASKEKISAQTEAGRNARFAMRNDREWEKLAQGWEKIDNDFAVRMRRADTYGKRVDILEQKLKNDYDIALKKAKTADERAKVEADYKDRMASVAEGNFNLSWFKAETAANQGQQKLDNDKAAKDADREMRLKIEQIRAYARGAAATKGGNVSEPDLKRVQAIQKALDGGNLTSENRTKLRNDLNEIVSKYQPDEAVVKSANQTTIKPGDNSGGKTVAGSEPPDGKYTIEKDGVSYHWGKSKNGGWKYFPDKK